MQRRQPSSARPFQRRKTERTACARPPARSRGSGRGRHRAWRRARRRPAVELPDEGRAGPDRAHQRIFAADELRSHDQSRWSKSACATRAGARHATRRVPATGRGTPRPARRPRRGREQQCRRSVESISSQFADRVVAIAEQADASLAGRDDDALRREPRIAGPERAPAFEQAGLAQQAAARRREAREEEPGRRRRLSRASWPAREDRAIARRTSRP